MVRRRAFPARPHQPFLRHLETTMTTPPPPPPAPRPALTPTGRLGQGELRRQVAGCLAADPGAAFTPGSVARALGKSAGATGNALATLAGRGEAERLPGSPVRYRATADTARAAAALPAAPARPRRPPPPRPPRSRPGRLPRRPRPRRPPPPLLRRLRGR